MRHAALLALIGLAACTTPPARYDAYAQATQAYSGGVGGEARRVSALPWPSAVVEAPPPAPRRRGARREPPASPPVTTCAEPLTLNANARTRCALDRRANITTLTARHAAAMASYFTALSVLATRFDAGGEMVALEASRTELLAVGEELQRAIGLAELEPFRPVVALVGLRPAFAAEMATHGWKLRQQWEVQAAALARLESLPAGGDAALARLSAAAENLRAAFEALVRSDAEALPRLAQARRALEG